MKVKLFRCRYIIFFVFNKTFFIFAKKFFMKKYILPTIAIFLFVATLFTCQIVDFSRLTASKIINIQVIDSTTVEVEAAIIDLSEESRTFCGICYSDKNQNPTINDSKVLINEVAKGTYVQTISNLKPDTKYYFRFFVIENEKPIYNLNGNNYTTTSTLYNGLVAYYPFNDNANDESGNGNNGTVNGATLTTDRKGNANSAFSFDGYDDYIDLGDWSSGGAMTFCLWVRYQSYNFWSHILDMGNGSPDNNIVLGNHTTTNNCAFNLSNGTNELMFVTNNYFALNSWIFITATIDTDGTAKLYKNVRLVNTKSAAYIPLNVLRTGQFLGKSNWAADSYFNGLLDDFRIYNRALTETEIQKLYNE